MKWRRYLKHCPINTKASRWALRLDKMMNIFSQETRKYGEKILFAEKLEKAKAVY